MFRRPLVFKSQPPVLKALRKHYTLHRRYLATSLKEQDQAKKVTSILAALVDQLDQPAFAEHRMGDVKPGELDLLGVIYPQLV